MIEIVLTFEDSGQLLTLTSQGHAKRANGLLSEACLGTSLLLRTFARLLSHTPGIKITGGTKCQGHLKLSVLDVGQGDQERLQAYVDFLLLGLRDLREEYPESINILIK